MALPGSGTISMNDIRIELGVPSQAPFSLDTARAGGYVALNPYSPTLPPSTGTVSLASWYSYCQSCTTLYAHNIYLSFNSHGALEGWASSADACTYWGTYPITLYSNYSTLGVGSTLYELYAGVYYPFNLVSFGPGMWIYDYDQGAPLEMTNSSSNVVATVDTCAPAYYYYVANYWIDCSGVSAYGIVVRSPYAITDAWSRESPSGGYFEILYGDSGPSYSYDSDGSQNSYCGY